MEKHKKLFIFLTLIIFSSSYSYYINANEISSNKKITLASNDDQYIKRTDKQKSDDELVDNWLYDKHIKFRRASRPCIILGAAGLTIGASFLFAGVGLKGYAEYLSTSTLSSLNSDWWTKKNVLNNFGGLIKMLMATGTIIAAFSLPLEIIGLALFGRARHLRNAMITSNKKMIIKPFCSLGSNMECGISIKI